MKNYKNSDYAVNKYAKGIVYRGQRHTTEVTLADFLAESSQLTEQDFNDLKALSDAIYYKQDRDTYNQAYLDVSINSLEHRLDVAVSSPEDEYIHRYEQAQFHGGIQILLESGKLTKVQWRRLVLHSVGKYSSHTIAKHEGVSQHAVMKSLHAAKKKLKKYFENGVLKTLDFSR